MDAWAGMHLTLVCYHLQMANDMAKHVSLVESMALQKRRKQALYRSAVVRIHSTAALTFTDAPVRHLSTRPPKRQLQYFREPCSGHSDVDVDSM